MAARASGDTARAELRVPRRTGRGRRSLVRTVTKQQLARGHLASVRTWTVSVSGRSDTPSSRHAVTEASWADGPL
jgi:hypothetical protein